MPVSFSMSAAAAAHSCVQGPVTVACSAPTGRFRARQANKRAGYHGTGAMEVAA